MQNYIEIDLKQAKKCSQVGDMMKCWEHKNDYIEKNKGGKGGWEPTKGGNGCGRKGERKRNYIFKGRICYDLLSGTWTS